MQYLLIITACIALIKSGICSSLTSMNTRAMRLFSSIDGINDINVLEAGRTGKKVLLEDIICSTGKNTFLVFLTHLGDLSSWELSQKLVYYMPKIVDSGTNLVRFEHHFYYR